ncbi:MAG: hypothetical protein VKJ24_16160 [Synechococcales bacterium]|nr:hypothetical protein [Synechococcales bacterium]
MKTLYRLPALFLALGLVGLAPAIAQAETTVEETYVSTSGSTRMLLQLQRRQGDYQTTIAGKRWSGKITYGRVLGHNGNRTIHATFKDSADPVPDRFNPPYCEGDLTLRQTVEKNRFVINAQWTVKGGKNCPAVGRTNTVRLVEDLPIADRQGDFYFENSKQWFGPWTGQNDFHTWDYWKAVSADGKLNCRATPNGKIVKVYKKGEWFKSRYDGRGIASAILGAENRETHPSAIVPSQIKGAPWLLTQDKCFVRANDRHIEPIPAWNLLQN